MSKKTQRPSGRKNKSDAKPAAKPGKSSAKKGKSPVDKIASDVLNVFKNNPTRAVTLKQVGVIAAAQNPGVRMDVREIIHALMHRGLVEQLGNGKFKFRSGGGEAFTGVVDMTSSGTLYVMVEGMEKDIMVEARNSGHALHGDTVKVLPIRTRRNGQIEGEVVEILQPSGKKYVGRLELSTQFAFVRIDNKKMPNDLFIPLREIKEAKDGDKVLVRVVEWPMNMKNPLGEILDVLGHAGDNDTEMHAILAEYDLPYIYPTAVSDEARRIDEKITERDYAERRDFRQIPTFTIDPADAKDFDDALSIRKVKDGVWEVGVHIADVTHYVRPNTLVESEAEERATSVYLVDRTIPMLPERLSNELCSLRPHEEKLCFSAVFELNENGEVLTEWFGRTVIYSDRRFAYEEAQEVIETGQGDLRDEILKLNELAKKMRAERIKNGAISFERAEAKFELDAKGKPIRVYFKEPKDSNQLIEEFMLLANRKVAEFIGKKGPGKPKRTFVYRIHDTPSPEKLGDFKAFITRFGYNIKAEKGHAVAKEMNKLLAKVKDRAEENIVSTLAIRTMAKAAYSTENIGHYGLAFDYYTHFTSPIRRYPDMMVHRLLAHYLAGGKSENQEWYQRQCDHSSGMETRATEAERASIKYKMVEYMQDKIDHEFDGVISGVTEWGIYVELEETMIEGMVSLRDMPDDMYIYDDKSYRVVGRNRGLAFTLGDRVKIRVLRADLVRKQLDFEMVGRFDFHTQRLNVLEKQRYVPEKQRR